MILKSVLFNIINSQQQLFFNRELGIERELRINFEEENTQLTIINGLKRTGKTNFLFQLYKQNFQDAFYINFGHPGLYSFDRNDFFKLDEVIKAFGNSVLFFDEIDEMEGWQVYVRQKIDEGYRVVLTASNADIFTDELTLSLTGRYVSKTLFPFSYNEFCYASGYGKNQESVQNFIKEGGFPAGKSGEYLSQLFDDIVVREIGLRNGIRDHKSFKRLAIYLLQNIGERITGNQVKNTLGIKTTTTAVDYLAYLESGYLMFYLPKFSYSVRKQMINPRKVYVADVGLAAANTFVLEDKMEQLFENLVYLNLRARYSEMYYFTEKYICDFIAFGKDKALEAIQVCTSLKQDNFEREVDGLFEAMEFFEFSRGTLVTMNQIDRFERNGKVIEVVPFHEFA